MYNDLRFLKLKMIIKCQRIIKEKHWLENFLRYALYAYKLMLMNYSSVL